MSDSQDDNVGGHESELTRAATRLAEAVAAADAEALRVAASDHAAALGSQATAMAASIARPVYSKLDALGTQIQQLAAIVTNARQADLTWRTDERDIRDAQSTRLYVELDKLIAAWEESGRRLGKIEHDVGEIGITTKAMIGRVGNLEETVDGMGARLGAVEGRLTKVESEQRELRTQVNTVLAHIQKDRQLLQQWREQHGE